MRVSSFDGGPPPSEEEPEEPIGVRHWVKRLARWALGALVLFALVAALARWLRPELESMGRYFVEHYGLAGMALGTFVADGFHFPVPPQFYMLVGIAAETPPYATLGAVTLGSLAGGTTGYFLARRLGRSRLVARWLKSSAKVVRRLERKGGYRMVIALSLTPIAYSLLCYLAGAYGLPKRLYAVIAAMRVPKLLLFYYLVSVGWSIQ
jgi:membrane protein YqaA with SNARE-associated domain